MARVKKQPLNLESLLFASPEQKVLKFLLFEPTSNFTPRVMSSRLKGVRGLGGVEGIQKILLELEAMGMVEFVDNRRSVRLQDECRSVKILKTLSSIADLSALKLVLTPISDRIILFGSRAVGDHRSESDYGLFVVSNQPEEVKKAASRHPLSKLLEVLVWTPDAYGQIEKQDSGLARKLSKGIVIWGPSW